MQQQPKYKGTLYELKKRRISQITKELITADLSKLKSWVEIDFLTNDLKELCIKELPDLDEELYKLGLTGEQQFKALNEGDI